MDRPRHCRLRVMARVRACKQCALPFTGAGSYCPRHAGSFGGFRRTQTNPVYRDPRWRKLAAKTVAEWVVEHGWVCPGWHRPPHPSHRLSANHVVPLAAGGAPFDAANVDVLCVTCNTAKGGRLG